MSRRQAWLILAAISLIVMRVADDDDNGTWIMGVVLYTWAWGAFWMEARDRKRA